MTEPSRIVFLGPQRIEPTLRDAVRSLGIDGPVATVTAGWQEREEEDQELNEHLAGGAVNLRLYARAERVFERDPELAGAYRARQETLRKIREICALRLGHAMEAARELLRRKGDVALLGPERLAALQAVRTLDEWHLERARRVHDEFEARWRPRERESLERERSELASILERSAAVAIAGGHVAVLLYRMRLFGMEELLRNRTVIAWSAGAMALSERVVLFHDDPPDGPGHPEALDRGLGLATGIVALPHARRRLRLDDAPRVSLFARRFAPAVCVALDPGSRADWTGGRWTSPEGSAARLSEDGDVVAMSA